MAHRCRNSDLVLQEVSAVRQEFPHLRLIEYNNGAALNGVIECRSQAGSGVSQFFYPLTVKIPFGYPEYAAEPCITQQQLNEAGFELSRTNRFIDPSTGVVLVRESTLLRLLHRVRDAFFHPPVHQRAPSQPQPQPPQQWQQWGGGGGGYVADNPYAQQQHRPQQHQPQKRHEEDPTKELRESLQRELEEMLKKQCNQLHAETTKEVKEAAQQIHKAKLQEMKHKAEAAQLRAEVEALEARVRQQEEEVTKTTRWVEENSAKLKVPAAERMVLEGKDALVVEYEAQVFAYDEALFLVGACGERAEEIERRSTELAKLRFDAKTRLEKAKALP